VWTNLIKHRPAAKLTIHLKFPSGLFAAERDPREALEPSDAPFDACAGLVKGDYVRWLFLAQHYRVSNRFLGWNENLIVAIYFAIRHANDDDPERPILEFERPL
jgi:hypothetical protein